MLFPILSYEPSLTPLICFSILPIPVFPTLFLPASVLYKMRLIQISSIIDYTHFNEHIPLLGFAHNKSLLNVCLRVFLILKMFYDHSQCNGFTLKKSPEHLLQSDPYPKK